MHGEMPSKYKSDSHKGPWEEGLRTIDEALANVTALQDQQVFHPIMLARPYVLRRCRQYIEQANLGYCERRDLHYYVERVTEDNEYVRKMNGICKRKRQS